MFSKDCVSEIELTPAMKLCGIQITGSKSCAECMPLLVALGV